MLTPTDPKKLCSHIAAHARAVDQLSAWPEDAASRRAFESLLGMPPEGCSWDLDRPFRCWKDENGKYQTQGLSTCGLVARGIWYRSGIDLPHFKEPYEPGSIFRELQEHALNAGAWSDSPIMSEGWIWIMGSGLATHACIVIRRNDDVIESIDGGQVDYGRHNLQCIKRIVRSAVLSHHVGCIDPNRMPKRLECEALNSWWYDAIEWVWKRAR